MDRHKATLIVLSPAFTDSESDSWLPAQENFVRVLNRIYPELAIVILSFHFPVCNRRQYDWHGNTVFAFNGAMKGKWHSAGLWVSVWQRLQQLRRTHHVIGMLSFFCSECAFLGHYFARRHSISHQIWILGQDAKKENKQVRRIRPSATELTAISDTVAATFQAHHNIQPAAVVPIGIDPSGPMTIPVPDRDITILGAGSLIPLKQYDLFIRVVQQAAAQLPGISAIICGDGPEAAALTDRVRSLNLQDQVTMAGKQTHQDTMALMQRCRLFLHTSAYEGFSSACLEALYAGAHVISFCQPMHKEIPHWHYVATEAEMTSRVLQLLQDANLDHSPVAPYTMDASAVSIMSLLGYQQSIPAE